MDIDPNLEKDIPAWEQKALEPQWIGIVASYPDRDGDGEEDKYHVEKTGFGQIRITQEKFLGGIFPVYETPPEKIGIPKQLLEFANTLKKDGCPQGTRKQGNLCIPYKTRGGKK